MTTNSALFGDEQALANLGEIIDGTPETIDQNDGTLNKTSEDSKTFDDQIKDELAKIERRKRKSGCPDDIQLMAEEFQKTQNPVMWSKIQNRLYKPLLKFLMDRCPNAMLVEDAVMITFARAYEYMPNYDASKSKFSTWIWTIAYRQLLYDMKIERRIETVNISDNFHGEELTPENAGLYETKDSDQTEAAVDYYMVDRHEIQEESCDSIIKKIYDVSVCAINEIQNPLTRQVVESKIIHNMTIKEISVMLDMNQSNVKNHLYKGKREVIDQIMRDNAELYDLYLDAMHEKDLACG